MTFLPDFAQFGLPLIPQEADRVVAELDIEPVPLGKDILFDFDAGDFVMTAIGGLQAASEAQALKQWITVALITPRGRLLIYPESFGSELPMLLGARLPPGALASELPRMLSDTLLVHDRIANITSVSTSSEDSGETIALSFDVVLDDDARLTVQTALGAIL